MTTLQEALITAALDASSRGLISGTTNWAAFVAESLKAALAQQGEAKHVGDTRFEGWLSEYEVFGATGYIKQDMRNAYWAGYSERAAAPAPQPAQGELWKLRAPLIQWHQNMAEVCRDSDGTAYLNHRDTAKLLQSAQPVAPLTDEQIEDIGFEMLYEVQRKDFIAFARAIEAAHGKAPAPQPTTVDDFEEWHKANFAQPLDRHGYTYTNAAVRNRWIGWQAAHETKGST